MKYKLLKKLGLLFLIFAVAFNSIGICVLAEEEEEPSEEVTEEVLEEELTDEELIESGLLSDPTEGDNEIEQPEFPGADIVEVPEDSGEGEKAVEIIPEEPEEIIPETIDYSKSESKKINLLSALGIVKTLPEAEEVITRKQFAEAIYRLLNLEAGFDSSNVTYFYDIDVKDSSLECINTLYTMGIMNGTADKVFSPDESMSYINAVVAVVRILGYETAAQKSGGYPSGYLNMAARLNLLTGKANDEGLLTGKALVNLFYQALFAEIFQIESYTGNEAKFSVSGVDLLEANFGYLKYEGLVVADGFASVGGRKTADIGSVVIKNGANDYLYKLLSNDGAVYIGKSVDYFANRDGEIIHMAEKASLKELVIDSFTIQGVDPYVREIKYLDGKKTKTARIDSLADFICNGVNYIPTSEYVENSNGSVRLLDSDSDGIYDCVFVENYDYYFASSVTSDGILKDVRFNTYFDFHLNEREYHTTIMKYGMEIPVGMISESELVAVLESPNPEGIKKITAYVYDNAIQGTVTALGDSVIEVDGKEYEYVNGFSAETVYIGDNAFFGLDTNGRICFSRKIYSNTRTYLYVVGFGTASALSRTCQIRAMNQEGDFEVYDFSENYRVNDSKGTAEKIEELLYDGGDLKPQLAAVSFDDEMKITKIELDTTPDGPRPLESEDVFTYNKNSTSGRLDVNRNVIAAEYWLTAKTRKFTIFTDSQGNIMEEMSSAATKTFKTTKSRVIVPMDIYDASDEDRVAGAVVFKLVVESIESYFGYDTNTFIVEKLFYKQDEYGDYVQAASGYQKGANVALTAEPDVFSLADWKPGDIYSVLMSHGGNVIKAVKRFSLSENPDDTSAIYYDRAYSSENPAVSSEKIATTSALTFGNLRNVVTTPLRAAYIEVEGTGDVVTYSFTSSSKVYVYNLTTKECKSTSVEELVPGKGKVFVISGYGQIYDLVVFEQ